MSLENSIGLESSGRAGTVTSESGHGWHWFLLVATVWLVINLITADRSPSVWQDEVSYSDPGINLATGRGWTTTAWPFQPRDEFFCSNVPLHPLALAGWVRIFGWSPTAVRSLNFVFTLIATALLWHGMRRANLLRSVRGRLGLTVLLFGGTSIAFSFRSGRPDMVAFLLMSVVVTGFFGAQSKLSHVRTFLGSLLLPLAALQVLPYAALLGAVAILIGGKRFVLQVALVGVGSALGLFAWLGFLKSQGLLGRFFDAVSGASSTTGGISTRLSEAISGVAVDPSSHLLALSLAGFAGSAVARHGIKGLRLTEPAVLGLALGVGIPAFVGFAGKFPIYYGWMKFVPMAVCAMAAWERDRSAAISWKWVRTAAVLMAVLAALGWPLRILVTLREWDDRDYARVQDFCASHVKPSDIAVCDYQAYYPVRRTAALAFAHNYLPVMDDADRRSVSVLVIDPQISTEILTAIGGNWTKLAEYALDEKEKQTFAGTAKMYRLAVYRRS